MTTQTIGLAILAALVALGTGGAGLIAMAWLARWPAARLLRLSALLLLLVGGLCLARTG